MKLFVTLAGIAIGVITLLSLVAFFSTLGNFSIIQQPKENTENASTVNTTVATTTTTPAQTAEKHIPAKTPASKEPVAAALSTISTPGPLIIPKKSAEQGSSTPQSISTPKQAGALNQQDIILFTNNERTVAGLSTFTFSPALAGMAEAKAKDMIAKQYFAHVSPLGTTVADLAVEYDYQYRSIGENLALGDFEDSKDVVNGWMNSPGHRANILSADFTEIGVAAIVGNYNGRRVWYAVQEFGRPMPKCALPDAGLEQKITIYQSQITMTETTLLHLKEEIEAPNTDEETYRAKVKDYNTIVKLYNDLVTAAKLLIAAYNAEVNEYNACIAGS